MSNPVLYMQVFESEPHWQLLKEIFIQVVNACFVLLSQLYSSYLITYLPLSIVIYWTRSSPIRHKIQLKTFELELDIAQYIQYSDVQIVNHFPVKAHESLQTSREHVFYKSSPCICWQCTGFRLIANFFIKNVFRNTFTTSRQRVRLM